MADMAVARRRTAGGYWATPVQLRTVYAETALPPQLNVKKARPSR